MPVHSETPTIAIIGGSGFYQLFDPTESEQRLVPTPYGSVAVTLGTLAERTVAFITRHGTDHSVAPHRINYRANLWALASLGVRVIVSSSAVGGLSERFPPGTLVLTDQLIDRTHGRADTFYDEGVVQHLAAADPFAPALHRLAARALTAAAVAFEPTATVVVIQGPRFSTRAESCWFQAAGAHTINMTMYPEVCLAAELNIDTVNLSFVTDSDAGVSTDDDSVDPDAASHTLVLDRLVAAQPRILAALTAIIRALPSSYTPRELIAPEAVSAVLGRAVAGGAAGHVASGAAL